MARPRKVENVEAETVVKTDEVIKEEQVQQEEKFVKVKLKVKYSPKHIVFMNGEFVVFENGEADVPKSTVAKLKEMGLI